MQNLDEKLMYFWEKNYKEHLEKGLFSKYLDLSFLKRNQRLSRHPGVIVLPGPSLEKNLEVLKDLKNKAVLIACDTVVFRLNEEGIIPDFVVSIDPQNDFLSFFVCDIDKSPYLVIPTSGSICLTKDWRGFIFFFNQTDDEPRKKTFLEKLTKPTKHFYSLKNRFFVGMTALQLSVILDLRPVIFVGADFAYLDGKWYCRGFLKRRYGKRKVPLVFDTEERNFLTTKLFRFYRDVLDKECLVLEKNKRLKFFNASLGISNLEKMKLEDFGKRFCDTSFNVKEIMRL